MLLRGEDGMRTMIVCRYNPCQSGKKATNSSYQQHRRHVTKKEKSRTCPRERFRKDLIKQLIKWRVGGDRLLVCLDANERIYKKKLGKALMERESLGMIEVVGTFTGQEISATLFRGKPPIDGVWVTPDVVVTSTCVVSVSFGIVDH